jgi:uncharacterized protein (TIGR02996 family)
MNDGDRLWSAILRRPFSRRLRQIFADCLEEQGDPRAEFIRLQDHAVPSDPWRQTELLRVHEAQWIGSIADHASDWHFRHGLLYQVTVDAERFLAHGHEWVRRPGLLGLRLTQVHAHIRGLAACPHLGRIPFLWLDKNSLGAREIEALASSPHLRRVQMLSLANNPIENEGLNHLAKAESLSELRLLRLNDTSLRPGWRPSAECTWRRLRELQLHLNPMADDTLLALLLAPAYANSLRSIRIDLCQEYEHVLSKLMQGRFFESLQSLGFSCLEPPERLFDLFASAKLTSLRKLQLHAFDSPLDAVTATLVRNTHFRKLRHLSLTGIDTSQGYAAFAEPGILPSLQSLDLGCCYRHDEAVPRPDVTSGQSALFAGPLVRRLRRFTLSGDRLPGDALAMLAGTGPLPLRDFRFRVGEGSSDALSELIAAGRLTRLRRLKLEGVFQPGFGAAISHPGQLPHLRHLWLGSCYTTDAEALCQATFPQLEYLHFPLVFDEEPPSFEKLECWLAGLRLRFFHLSDNYHALLPFRRAHDFPYLERFRSFQTTQALEDQLAAWAGLGRLRVLQLGGRVGELNESELAQSPHWAAPTRVQGTFAGQTAPRLQQRLGPRAAVFSVEDEIPF